MAKGFAIQTENGSILVRTVCLTPRAAKVNWLHTYCQISIFSWTKDNQIEALFRSYSRRNNVKLVKVEIKLKEI